MKLWKVTMELWRETWSGHDQCDSSNHIEIVEASRASTACAKGSRKALEPYKRGCSHYIWVQNIEAEEITVKEARELRRQLNPPRKKMKPTLCVRRR